MLLIIMSFLAATAAAPNRDSAPLLIAAAQQIRFTSVDLIIDTNDQPLAVYQLEFEASKGDVQIVGIEGSSHPAFGSPPYFDPQAIQKNRVILAAFNTAGADDLPRGKVRIATLHLQITGDIEPAYKVTSTVLATVDGEPIPGAKVTVQIQRVPS